MPTLSNTSSDTFSSNQTVDKPFLVKQWEATFKKPPSSSIQTNLLKQVMGWQQQAKQQGGFSAKERKQLLGGVSKLIPVQAVGSQLIRVWKDETHHVTVLAKGYLYEGIQWRSLSAIAKQITGTPWSGPVFFGLKQ